MSAPPRSHLVYASGGGGRICPDCGQPKAEGCCRAQARQAAVPQGPVRVSREKAGRGGKLVTVVRGLPLDQAALAALGKRLRTQCGTGGTAKDGRLELQGDHVDRVLTGLLDEGFAAKRSGG